MANDNASAPVSSDAAREGAGSLPAAVDAGGDEGIQPPGSPSPADTRDSGPFEIPKAATVTEAFERLAGIDAGRQLLSGWGDDAAAREAIGHAQSVAASILSAIGRDSPGKARKLWSIVESLDDFEQVSLIRELASIGRRSVERKPSEPQRIIFQREGADMPDDSNEPVTLDEVQAALSELYALNEGTSRERSEYRSARVQEQVRLLEQARAQMKPRSR